MENKDTRLPITNFIEKTARSVLILLATRDHNQEAQKAASDRTAYDRSKEPKTRSTFIHVPVGRQRPIPKHLPQPPCLNSAPPSSGRPRDPLDQSEDDHPNKLAPGKDRRRTGRDRRRYHADESPSVRSGKLSPAQRVLFRQRRRR